MNNKLKFSIITTCKNSEEYILETVESVINQSIFNKSKNQLEYIIIDSASTDNTLKILNEIAIKNKNIQVISEKDDGMYEGLAKGFKRCTGDIIAYINAGDFYNLTAFSIVENIFKLNNNVKWLTGEKFLYNDNSEIINSYVPYKYRSNLIQSAVYGRYLPFIQQESTFWKKEIMKEIDFDLLKKFKFAGDYYMWNCFSKKNQIYILKSYLAGFKYHPNQITFRDTYFKQECFKETKLFKKKINLKDFLYILLDIPGWILLTLTRKINLNRHIYFDTIENQWVNKSNAKFNTIYAWATDFSTNTGEGILARKFLENLNKDFFISNINQKFLFKNKKYFPNKAEEKGKINFSLYKRYILPIIGIFYLWYHYFKGKKIAFLNFLPLWNTLLVLLLPPNTILGPITGSIYKDKVKNIQGFIRKFIVPILYYLNARILILRSSTNLVFSTDLLKKYLPNNILKKSKFNFVYSNINLKKEIPFKKTDIIIYYRNYFTKSNKFYENILKKLEKETEINFCYIGDKIENLHKNYLGRLTHEKTLKLIEGAKFSIVSEENFSSLFTLECIENHLDLFASKKITIPNEIISKDKIHIIDYDDFDKSADIVIKKIKSKIIQKKFLINFDDLNIL